MPRIARSYVHADYYHVLNRGQMRQQLFAQPTDYQLFLTLLRTAPNVHDIDLLAYCVMPNHWHFVVKPVAQSALSAYFHWVGGTHALRWNRSRGRIGLGHVYQGRFKSFPIRRERHLLTVLRYVEANPVRAGLVGHASDWPWSSNSSSQAVEAPSLANWPMPKPANWQALLDDGLDSKEIERIREASRAGQGLDTPVRRPGRPRTNGDSPHFGEPI